MTTFDGRKFATKKLTQLAQQVKKLKVKPKLVTILIGDNPASSLYTHLKKQAAHKIGAELKIQKLPAKSSVSKVTQHISALNSDQSVQGIMIQLPLPENLKQSQKTIISQIAKNKDVDGLTSTSPFVHPTASAVLEILSQAPNTKSSPICLVGATGFVGTKLTKLLKAKGYKVDACDIKTKALKTHTLKAKIVVSATGKPNLIKPDMVQKGSILIDVGAPKGDIDPRAYSKAEFVSPVPGGVGPVTISCLLENLVEASYNT